MQSFTLFRLKAAESQATHPIAQQLNQETSLRSTREQVAGEPLLASRPGPISSELSLDSSLVH